MKKDIREVASILDEVIEKGEKIEKTKRLQKSLKKSLSFDIDKPHVMQDGSPFYNPYMRLPDGSFAPFPVEHWTSIGKNREGYRTTLNFYNMARPKELPLSREIPFLSTDVPKFAKSIGGREKLEMLAKAMDRGLPIGTIHEWNGVKYQKTPQGWIPVSQGKDGKAKPTGQDHHVIIEESARIQKLRDVLGKKQKEERKQNENLETQIEDAVQRHVDKRSSSEKDQKEKQESTKESKDKPKKKESDIFSTSPEILKKGSTEEMYKEQDGTWSKERKQIHEKILSKFLDDIQKTPEGQKPVVVLTGGGTASGKGGVKNEMMKRVVGELADIDSDKIKAEIPEYQQMVKSDNEEVRKNAAGFSHMESSELSSELIRLAIEGNKSFVYDSTFSKADKMEKLINQLKTAGYHVQIAFADLPKEEAYKREKKRSEEGDAYGNKRSVSPEIIESTHTNAPKCLGAVHHLADAVYVYSTMGKSPEIKYERVGEELKRFDEEHLKEMHSRGHTIKSENGEELSTDYAEDIRRRLKEAIKSTEIKEEDFEMSDVIDEGVTADEYESSSKENEGTTKENKKKSKDNKVSQKGGKDE